MLNFFNDYLVVCEFIRKFAPTETNDKLINKTKIYEKRKDLFWRDYRNARLL